MQASMPSGLPGEDSPRPVALLASMRRCPGPVLSPSVLASGGPLRSPDMHGSTSARQQDHTQSNPDYAVAAAIAGDPERSMPTVSARMAKAPIRRVLLDSGAEHKEQSQGIRLPHSGASTVSCESGSKCEYVTHAELQRESRGWYEALVREIERFNQQQQESGILEASFDSHMQQASEQMRVDALSMEERLRTELDGGIARCLRLVDDRQGELRCLGELHTQLQAMLPNGMDGCTTSIASESALRSLRCDFDVFNAEQTTKLSMLQTQSDQNRLAAAHAEAAVVELRRSFHRQCERHEVLSVELREAVSTMQQDMKNKLAEQSQQSSTDVGQFVQHMTTVVEAARTSLREELREEAGKIIGDVSALPVQLNKLELTCESVSLRFDDSCRRFDNGIRDISAKIAEIEKRSPAKHEASVVAPNCEAMRNHMSELVAESCLRFDDRIQELSTKIEEIQKISPKEHDASIATPNSEEIGNHVSMMVALEGLPQKLLPSTGSELSDLRSRIEDVEVLCRYTRDALAQRKSCILADEAVALTARVEGLEQQVLASAGAASLQTPAVTSEELCEVVARVDLMEVACRETASCLEANFGKSLDVSCTTPGIFARLAAVEQQLASSALVMLAEQDPTAVGWKGTPYVAAQTSNIDDVRSTPSSTTKRLIPSAKIRDEVTSLRKMVDALCADVADINVKLAVARTYSTRDPTKTASLEEVVDGGREVLLRDGRRRVEVTDEFHVSKADQEDSYAELVKKMAAVRFELRSELDIKVSSLGASLEARIGSVEKRLPDDAVKLGTELLQWTADIEGRVSKIESSLLETAHVWLRLSRLEAEVKKQSALVLAIVEDRERKEAICGMPTSAKCSNTSPENVNCENVAVQREEMVVAGGCPPDSKRLMMSTKRQPEQPSASQLSESLKGSLAELVDAVNRSLVLTTPMPAGMGIQQASEPLTSPLGSQCGPSTLSLGSAMPSRPSRVSSMSMLSPEKDNRSAHDPSVQHEFASISATDLFDGSSPVGRGACTSSVDSGSVSQKALLDHYA